MTFSIENTLSTTCDHLVCLFLCVCVCVCVFLCWVSVCLSIRLSLWSVCYTFNLCLSTNCVCLSVFQFIVCVRLSIFLFTACVCVSVFLFSVCVPLSMSFFWLHLSFYLVCLSACVCASLFIHVSFCLFKYLDDCLLMIFFTFFSVSSPNDKICWTHFQHKSQEGTLLLLEAQKKTIAIWF